MKKLIAFHGKQSIKEKYLKRVAMHRKLDHLVQGIGWESNGKTRGCAVGCTLEKYDHSAYETELGIPEMIARLEDCIFEGLPVETAMKWPELFLNSITVGKSLSKVGIKFLLEINRRNLDRLDEKWKKEMFGPIEQVIEVLEDWLKTGKPNESAARSAAWSAGSAARSAAGSAGSAESARSAARSAAESARSAAESAAESARSAAESARSAAESAWSAAWSARSAAWSAESARYAARSAAESAARSAAWSARSAARSAEYEWMADTLVELLKKGCVVR